jgi:hypothetical protein
MNKPNNPVSSTARASERYGVYEATARGVVTKLIARSESMEEVIRLTERNDRHFLVRVGRDYLTVPQFKTKVGLKR